MRTVTPAPYKVYSLDELTADAREQAVENLYDINIGYEWWEFTFEDASNIGLKIEEFDIDRGSYVKADFTEDACFTAHKIIDEHGETCETYKTASVFLADRDTIINGAEKDENGDFIDEYKLDEELDEIESEFLKSISEDYRIILSNEYDYRASEKAIIETIKANEFEFTEDGKLA